MNAPYLNLLNVDLTSKTISDLRLDYDYYKGFIGGWGVGIKLAYEQVKAGIEPTDPSTPIIICAGLISGTSVPGSSRLAIITKYPLTGAVAMGNGGLNFADALQHAGYNIINITGASEEGPIYLEITEKGAAIKSASDLWGRDLYETTDLLTDRYGSRSSVLAIGPAGENGCNISLALVDNCGTVGKGGLGAVMGSKGLKAVVVRGDKLIEIKDKEKYHAALKNVNARLAKIENQDRHIELGTYWKWDNWFENGFATENWNRIYPKEKATELFGKDAYLKEAKGARMACVTCPLPDREILHAKQGRFKGLITYAGGFAGRAANLFTRCGVESCGEVIKLQDVLNRMGICCHGITSLIDFAVELYESGIINNNDTEGMKLERNFSTAMQLIEDTAYKKGFGRVLADGYPGFFRRYGDKLKDMAVQSKGLDILYDPRLVRFGTKPFVEIVNPRGGHHQPGVSPTDSLGATEETLKDFATRIGVTEDAQKRIFTDDIKVHVGRLTKYTQEYYAVMTALGICSKAPIGFLYSMDDCADLISSVYGIDYDTCTLKKDAERIWNLYRIINAREGFSSLDDIVPPKWFIPLKGDNGDKPIMDYFGTRVLTEADVYRMRDDYYEECGWDIETGMPSEDKIKELDIDVLYK